MARTPYLERTVSIRVLGAAFIALMLFFVWLTYAVFDKKFVSSVPVTLDTSTTGLSLPRDADVKLRGMIVGEVRSVNLNSSGDGVVMKIAMDPKLIDDVPKGVTAEIVPKTLFGEKYVSLIPPKTLTASSGHLEAGDVISKADVPIEVENLLNDLYPLLEAVHPAELNYTLSAIATALSGRGEKLGTSLVNLNDYLQQINPDVPQLVTDLKKLGTVSDTYAAAMPDLGRLLTNAVVTGNTIVAKRSQLAAFFAQGTALANTLTDFVKDNGDNLIELNKLSRPILETTAKYSVTFPCFITAMDKIIPSLDSVYRGHEVHINLHLEPLTKQPTGYASDENAVTPSKSVIDSTPAAQPTCLDLNEYNAGHIKYTNDNPYPGPNFDVYKLVGLKGTHNKFRAAADSSMVDVVGPSVDGIDSASQRADLKKLLAADLGTKASSVPDLGTLLVSPVIRGSEVTVSEAR